MHGRHLEALLVVESPAVQTLINRKSSSLPTLQALCRVGGLLVGWLATMAVEVAGALLLAFIHKINEAFSQASRVESSRVESSRQTQRKQPEAIANATLHQRDLLSYQPTS
ncbi:hypothetical protein AWZ03_012825 [Drosophila navojoa]|uniref:Uncharacterized protein n=1 Tax=Drosophila navojoa TaxID=7232 RepID=A0A484AYR5_DRONA|nr:hypothetical protein AWZ03_012825 [Drosophila navojoa]